MKKIILPDQIILPGRMCFEMARRHSSVK